ncbi:hypothetical protein ACC817_00645 [Rhizobium ruizarguesonis]|uniref:hypothetical protein n=1 Tax=Rhizobium ruizarguesonis TaxID=2081791 RepID=UPI00102FB442|nr:hypothetical protein [Rhizobium ruizarguesonis]
MKEIKRAERKIRRIKSILKSLDEDDTSDRSADLASRIEDYRHLAYMWRSFGDAIAFLFMDKFALKQVFYNTHNTNAKQDAGFILDKEGFAGEWREIEKWLRRGVPALLSDITNTIRHGDICLMVGPDPILIEVKLGELDRRGRQQRDSIRQLMEFYDTDEAAGLRGLDKVRRTAHETPEVSYADIMEETIIEAAKAGAALISPEKGLWYLAISDGSADMNTPIHKLGLKHPIAYPLNEVKSARAWSPYSPFVLSIRDRETLYRFIWGDVYVLVVYDLEELALSSASQGLSIEFFSREEESVFELREPDTGRNIRLAWQMFDRLALEFTSPAWLLSTSIERLVAQEAVPLAPTAQTDVSQQN